VDVVLRCGLNMGATYRGMISTLLEPRLHDATGCRAYNRSDNRLYRVNKHPTGCHAGLITRFDNRFDNRVERTATVRSTVFNKQPLFVQPVVKPGCTTGNRLNTRYSRLSNRLSNGFDNRSNVYIHDRPTTGCQTGLTAGLTTGLTTGCIV